MLLTVVAERAAFPQKRRELLGPVGPATRPRTGPGASPRRPQDQSQDHSSRTLFGREWNNTASAETLTDPRARIKWF